MFSFLFQIIRNLWKENPEICNKSATRSGFSDNSYNALHFNVFVSWSYLAFWKILDLVTCSWFLTRFLELSRILKKKSKRLFPEGSYIFVFLNASTVSWSSCSSYETFTTFSKLPWSSKRLMIKQFLGFLKRKSTMSRISHSVSGISRHFPLLWLFSNVLEFWRTLWNYAECSVPEFMKVFDSFLYFQFVCFEMPKYVPKFIDLLPHSWSLSQFANFLNFFSMFQFLGTL